MKCPRCGLLSPPSAERCDCGHAFVANAAPIQSVAQPRLSQSSKLATRMLYGAVIAVVIGVIISIAMNTGSSSSTSKPTDVSTKVKNESLEDRALKVGCGQFARLVVDVRKGILTDQEIREKAKDIRLRFHASEKPAAKEAGDHLLRAFTIGNQQDWNASFKEVRELCGY
jgi:hypothetical protein